MNRHTKIVATGIATVLMLLALFCIGEVALRIWLWKKYGVEESGAIKVGPMMFDQNLGWRPTNSYSEQLEGATAGGKTYPIRRSQNEWGFRLFGDIYSSRPKVLVIGDSFTQAIEVSDDKTYYALLKELLKVEVFAYGGGGYGTLQEYMILDRYVDLIKPDVLLWQYCTNDFINNDPELELLSIINNNGMRRPYWVNHRIVYQLPKVSLVRLRDWTYRYSRLFYLILSRLDKLAARGSVETVETFIDKQGLDHLGFARAVEITDELMGRVRSRVGSLPIVAFNCTTHEPYTEMFQRISSSHDIIFWRDVAEAVQTAQDRGEDVLASDMHWNELGNRLVANALVVHLSKFFEPTALLTVKPVKALSPTSPR